MARRAKGELPRGSAAKANAATPRGAAPRAVPALLLALLVACAHLPVFRLGFFADDFLFFDAARRMPVADVLLGRYGIYPWYRPLARELYFYLLLGAGPLAPFVAHALALAAIAACAWWLHRIGTRLFGARAGVAAAVVFATSHLARFVAGWASAFQDDLSAALVVGAIAAELDGRAMLTLALAAAAPFAKETGLVVWPLLLAAHFTVHGRWPARRWLARHGAALAGVVAIHALVRLTWTHAGNTGTIERSLPALAAALAAFARSYAPWGRLPDAVGPALPGVIAAAACALWLAPAGRSAERGTAVPRGRALAFAAFALLAGLAPLVAGNLLRLSVANTWYAYPALPWGALVLGVLVTRLPARVVLVGLPLAALLAVWGLPWRAPDLDQAAGWLELDHSSWWEELRLSAATVRLRDDLGRLLAARADSTVVLYTDLPIRSYLQQAGSDGPVTRELLGDPTVVGRFLSECPPGVPPRRMAVVRFDSASDHLALVPRERGEVIARARGAIVTGYAQQVPIWLAYGGLADARALDATLVRAAAALLRAGPAVYVAELARAGFADTLADAPARLARAASGAIYPLAPATLERVFRRPCSALAHAELAESLLVHDCAPLAGVEARVALALGGPSCRPLVVLGVVLADAGELEPAERELRAALALPPEEPHTSLARRELEQVQAEQQRAWNAARAGR